MWLVNFCLLLGLRQILTKLWDTSHIRTGVPLFFSLKQMSHSVDFKDADTNVFRISNPKKMTAQLLGLHIKNSVKLFYKCVDPAYYFNSKTLLYQRLKQNSCYSCVLFFFFL